MAFDSVADGVLAVAIGRWSCPGTLFNQRMQPADQILAQQQAGTGPFLDPKQSPPVITDFAYITFPPMQVGGFLGNGPFSLGLVSTGCLRCGWNNGRIAAGRDGAIPPPRRAARG